MFGLIASRTYGPALATTTSERAMMAKWFDQNHTSRSRNGTFVMTA